MTAAQTTVLVKTEEGQNEISINRIVDDQSSLAATIEQEIELVSLDKDPTTSKWTLSLGHGYAKQWQKATEDDQTSISSRNNVFIVSLLGNTTAGKSFVTKHLLANTENGPHIVDESDIESSTTGNINCFESKATNDAVEKMLVLDYEGEKGSSFPLMLHARRLFAERVGLMTEYAKERRKAVTDYFPKLAYVLSNIVILIGKEELISADYLTRCHEFALSANANVNDVPFLPVLIIIENKCSLAKKFDIKDVTEEFFNIHKSEAVPFKKYFSEIHCLRLPHTEQLQKVKGKIIDGEAIFHDQIAALKQLITEVMLRHRDRLITQAQWLFLLERVLINVSNGKAVSIHSLLSIITDKTGDDVQFIAKRLFESLYRLESIHTPKYYRHCRSFAMQVLSRNIALKLLHQKNILSDRVIRDTSKTKLLSLWEMLDNFKPCEAPYNGRGTSCTGNTVFCYQFKAAHPSHRTSEEIKNLSWISSLFGWSSTATWDGDFISSVPDEPTETELNDFTNRTIELVNSFKQNNDNIYMEFKRLLEEVGLCSFVRTSEMSMCACCLQRKRYGLVAQVTWIYFHSLDIMSSSVSICKLCKMELNMIRSDFKKAALGNNDENVTETKTVENNSLSKDDSCIICCDGEKDHALVPCGHRGFCLVCATQLQEQHKYCPICKKGILAILKVHNV